MATVGNTAVVEILQWNNNCSNCYLHPQQMWSFTLQTFNLVRIKLLSDIDNTYATGCWQSESSTNDVTKFWIPNREDLTHWFLCAIGLESKWEFYCTALSQALSASWLSTERLVRIKCSMMCKENVFINQYGFTNFNWHHLYPTTDISVMFPNQSLKHCVNRSMDSSSKQLPICLTHGVYLLLSTTNFTQWQAHTYLYASMQLNPCKYFSKKIFF